MNGFYDNCNKHAENVLKLIEFDGIYSVLFIIQSEIYRYI